MSEPDGRADQRRIFDRIDRMNRIKGIENAFSRNDFQHLLNLLSRGSA
jgi:hypothetical protein